MQLSGRLLLVCLLWSRVVLGDAATLDALVSADARPTAATVGTLDASSLPWSETQRARYLDGLSSHFAFLTDQVEALLPMLAEHDLFLLARDSDELYDALMAAIAAYPVAAPLAEHVHRVQFSTSVSQEPPAAVLRWLAGYRLDVNRLIRGERKAVLIDIGWSGSQPTRILRALLSEMPDSGADFARDARALLDNVEVRLMGPSDTESYDAFRAGLQALTRLDRSSVLAELDGTTLRYRGVLDATVSRAAATRLAKALQQARRSWDATPSGLSADGTRLEFGYGSDRSIDRERVIVWQHGLARHFAAAPLRSRIDPLLAAAVAPRRGRIAASVVVPEIPAERVPPAFRDSIAGALPAPAGLHAARLRPALAGEQRLVFPTEAGPSGVAVLGAYRQRLERLAGAPLPLLPVERAGEGWFTQRLPAGTSGREWLQGWLASGRSDAHPGLDAFGTLVGALAGYSQYLRNLTPDCFWYDGDRFWITDLGGTLQAPPPEVAWNTARNLRDRWDRRLAVRLADRLRPTAPPVPALALEEASAYLDPKLRPMFLLTDGHVLRIDTRLRDKAHAAVFAGLASDGRRYVLKAAKDPDGEASLARQRSDHERVAALGVPTSRLVTFGRGYLLFEAVEGRDGAAWLAARPAAGDAALGPLRTFLETAVGAGVFVSGLWPSHVVFDEEGARLVNLHGLREGQGASSLWSSYRTRFEERWTVGLPKDCGAALLSTVFSGRGTK